MKFNIEIDLGNFSEEQILGLAQYRGYRINEEQTPEDYLAEKGSEFIAEWLSERLIRETKQQKRVELNNLVANVKSEISTCLTISKVEE